MSAEVGNVLAFRARHDFEKCPPPPVVEDATEEALERFKKAFDAIMASDFDHATKLEIATLMREMMAITARIHIMMASCASKGKTP